MSSNWTKPNALLNNEHDLFLENFNKSLKQEYIAEGLFKCFLILYFSHMIVKLIKWKNKKQ